MCGSSTLLWTLKPLPVCPQGQRSDNRHLWDLESKCLHHPSGSRTYSPALECSSTQEDCTKLTGWEASLQKVWVKREKGWIYCGVIRSSKSHPTGKLKCDNVIEALHFKGPGGWIPIWDSGEGNSYPQPPSFFTFLLGYVSHDPSCSSISSQAVCI